MSAVLVAIVQFFRVMNSGVALFSFRSICKMVVVFELLFVELKAMRTLDNREMCCVYCSESACSLNSDGMDGLRIKRE